MKKAAPFTAGIEDGLRCVALIRRSRLGTKNRLAFLTLDSVLEISPRVFLKHRRRLTLDPVKHRRRDVLVSMAKKHLQVDNSVWEQLTYCYEDIRCPLYHQASDMTVTDAMLDDFADTVTYLINQMFGIDAVSVITEESTMGD